MTTKAKAGRTGSDQEIRALGSGDRARLVRWGLQERHPGSRIRSGPCGGHHRYGRVRKSQTNPSGQTVASRAPVENRISRR